MNKVLVICGPTCVGKTGISIEIAKKYNGEIINGDSMQVYKGMNIGTAKIKEDEKENIPHHLFDIKELNESFSVAEYQSLIRKKIKEIAERGKMPIIVGGTGLYLKAALYDYYFSEQEKKDYGLEDKSTEELYNLLSNLDPDSSKTIHPNNRKRIIRAIEIFYENGFGKEEINRNQTHQPIFDTLFLGLTRDRKELYELIDLRVDEMMSNGLENEVKHVLDNSAICSTCRQAIGYKEFIPYFEGKCDIKEVVSKIKSNTHKFAKCQFTWFNHQMDVKWVDVTKNTKNNALETAKNIIEEWINE